MRIIALYTRRRCIMAFRIGSFFRTVAEHLGLKKEEPKGLNLTKYLSLENINKNAKKHTGAIGYSDSYVAPNGPSKGGIKNSGNSSGCGGTCGA
jgi:hypothetical protein